MQKCKGKIRFSGKQEIQDFVLLFEIQKQIYRNEKEGERDHFKKEVIV